MKDLKFRAWDEFNGQYWHSQNFHKLSLFFDRMEALIDGENELIFERYTGLIDSDTKEEIYENDIILYDNRLGIIKWTSHGFNGVYTNGDGSWDDEWEDGISHYGKIYKRGNIHQNMNLLDED